MRCHSLVKEGGEEEEWFVLDPKGGRREEGEEDTEGWPSEEAHLRRCGFLSAVLMLGALLRA